MTGMDSLKINTLNLTRHNRAKDPGQVQGHNETVAEVDACFGV
jgi:hypothetical protein